MEKKKFPLFELVISESDEVSGVDAIGIVEYPAIEQNFIYFGKDEMKRKLKFQEANAEEQVLFGPIMIADMPIYRFDETYGDHYVVFRAETIKQIVQKYFKNTFNTNFDVNHSSPFLDGIYMFESFICGPEHKAILEKYGYTNIPDGSWFASVKIENTDIWTNYIKTGDIKGFSIEGMFVYNYLDSIKMSKEEPTANEIYDEEKAFYDIENLLKQNGENQDDVVDEIKKVITKMEQSK